MSNNVFVKPNALEMTDYETLLGENVAVLQQIKPDYKPLASDDYMLLVEAFTYRELHLRQLFNNRLMATLPQFANGSDLDSAGERYDVKRLPNESNEALRARIFQSLDGFSTAGSIESYQFHARSVNSVIDDAKAYSPVKGEVVVAIASFEDERETLVITPELVNAVDAKLHTPKIRPVTAQVSTLKASDKEVVIDADIFLFDMNHKETVKTAITRNLSTNLNIGKTLTYSQLMRYLHVDGVFKANPTSHNNDITCLDNEILRLRTPNLQFKTASEAM